ncbi:hypothetical protein KC973_01195 [Candidatus Saccharibacteria bacterium]|nr:hypothetical protein [Candidatus Saccharibacteria bacterium]
MREGELPPRQPQYESIDALVSRIDGPNGDGCAALLVEYRELFTQTPGSSGNHQAWPGGYLDHVTEIMNIGSTLYHTMSQMRELPFTESDVLLITFWHDMEKPFKYTYDPSTGELVKNPDLLDKTASEEFKRDLMKRFGIELNAMQANALEFVEGIRDDKYRKDSRVMGELAAMCHMADLWSARGWYNHPLPYADDWEGAARVNPGASAVWLETEFPTD